MVSDNSYVLVNRNNAEESASWSLPTHDRGRNVSRKRHSLNNLPAGLLLGGIVWMIYSHFSPHLANSERLRPFSQPKEGAARPNKLDEFSQKLDRAESINSLYGVGQYQGRSWLQHLESLDEEGLAPSTKWAQTYLHKHQNPSRQECYGKKFYLLRQGENDFQGLGSILHVITFALASAIQHDRILMWDEVANGRNYVEEDCLVDGIRSLDCLFEPLSSCPRDAITAENSIPHDQWIAPQGSVPGWYPGSYPEVFSEVLDTISAVTLTGPAKKLAWRTQAVAYASRLNRASLARILEMRLSTSDHMAWAKSEVDGAWSKSSVPFPLPKGTWNMHVRHGDKGSEMELMPFRDYVERAESYVAENPLAYRKQGFVSSEDPAVFEEAKAIATLKETDTTANHNWIWYMSKINRINGGPIQQLKEFGNRSETTLSWMAEAMMALECQGYVGTLTSNWNRLINELRCVWSAQCYGPYLEVGPEDDWKVYHY